MSTLSQPARKRAIDCRTEIDGILRQLDSMSASMRERQVEIDKTHAEIAVLRAETRNVLDRLEARR